MKRKRRRSINVGAPPGTLVVDPDAPTPKLSVIAYDGDNLQEVPIKQPKEIEPLRSKWPLIWLNVEGLGDTNVLREIGTMFKLHPLLLEDVVNVRQRPKVEEYENYLFVVLRMITLEDGPTSDQMSMVVGKGLVITFQETPGDCFNNVRDLLRKKDARLRRAGADYLAYSLIDSLIDHYFPILEDCGERLDHLQDEVLGNPAPAVVQKINQLKRELLTLRRAIWPLRDELSVLLRRDTFIGKETATYLRDAYDHTLMLIDTLETLREISGSLMDVYLSSVSNRMNEVMKLLTIVATIFIPLTFIAGVYGMNFNPQASPLNMPELNWYWGYPACLGSMVLVTLLFTWVIWRRGWFSNLAPTPHVPPKQP